MSGANLLGEEFAESDRTTQLYNFMAAVGYHDYSLDHFRFQGLNIINFYGSMISLGW